MLRSAWKPALALTAPAAAGYWYYNSREQTFDLPVRVRGPDGKAAMSTRTLPLMSMPAVDARIRENATEHTVSRPGIIWRHSTGGHFCCSQWINNSNLNNEASVAANDPLEDATAHQVIRRDEGDGDLLFFTVMDGHGGYYTSQVRRAVSSNSRLSMGGSCSPASSSMPSLSSSTPYRTLHRPRPQGG